nr:3-hydroxyacyl-CoA dehydrogenase family protein [Mameliella alba]
MLPKLQRHLGDSAATQTLVELGQKTLCEACAAQGIDPDTAIGLARYSVDGDTYTDLVEIVPGNGSPPAVVEDVREGVEAAGLVPVVSSDMPGRIVDRLMRPYLNRALRAAEDGIATPEALDQAIEMGLGHRTGPMTRLRGDALLYHHDVAARLHEDLGEAPIAPPRPRASRTASAPSAQRPHPGQKD